MKVAGNLILFWLASSVFLVATTHLGSAGVNGDTKTSSKFTFSKLFDFKSFKSLFHKSYKSPGEESHREKIFMSNLLRSFLSKIGYKHKKNSSYLSINSMSDWTEEEFEKTLIDPKVYLESTQADFETLRTLETMIEQIENGDSMEYNNFLLSERLKQQKTKGPSNLRKYLNKISFNNLNLTDKFNSLTKWKNDISIEAGNRLEGFLWRSLYNLPKRSNLPDQVFLDHRDSGCMPLVKSQKRCLSCYIFSTMALYEWAYCRLTGKRASFSEQYVLDCGSRLQMNGCGGGDEAMVAKFVEKYGFESSNDMYYMAKEMGFCPYDKLEDDKETELDDMASLDPGLPADLDDESMGSLRMNKPQLFYVGLENIEQQLKVSPVIIAFRTSGNFRHYGGGVDLGHGCEKKPGLHSMLIVGSGRENGYEYWLIRNSFGTGWGDEGHWKLAKNNNCYTIANSGMALEALNHRKVPKELVNSTIPLIELKGPNMVVYNFTENPKHNRDFLLKSIARIMRKIGTVQ